MNIFDSFCLSYKKKDVAIAQILTFINKDPRQMSHIPIDLVRRDRVMSVCVCLCVCACMLRYFVSPMTHEPLIGHMFQRLHFFAPWPKQELLHELVNTRYILRLFKKDLSIFSKNLSAVSLTKTTSLVTFQYQTLLRGK